VKWCNGRGELLCRTGIGKVRGQLEIDTELIGNDITLEWSLVLHIRVCDMIQCMVLRQAFGELPLTFPATLCTQSDTVKCRQEIPFRYLFLSLIRSK
jgi:hypothetical protein